MQGDSSPEKARQTDRETDLKTHDVESTDADTTVAPEETPDAPLTARKRRRRRPWGWIITAIVLFLALGGVIAASVHLWNVSLAWEERVNELTAINYGLGEDLVTEQETVLTQEDQIELLTQQRETLQQRVLDLSETANLSRDNVATAQQEIEALADLVAQAAAVSNALNRCVDSQEQLAQFLSEVQAADPEGPPVYDPADLAAYEQSVDDLCDAATAANAQLQRDLTS